MHLLAALQRRQEPDSSPGGPPNNSTASPTQSPTLGVNPTASATITDQSSIPTPPAQPHKPGSNSTVIAVCRFYLNPQFRTDRSIIGRCRNDSRCSRSPLAMVRSSKNPPQT